jgi:hypothetical protein
MKLWHATLRLLGLTIWALVSACSDPGSGGSGLPSGVTTGSPAVSVGQSILGTIEAIGSARVTIGGTVYLFSEVEIVAADLSLGSANDLVVGATVRVTALDPNATIKWRIGLLAGN